MDDEEYTPNNSYIIPLKQRNYKLVKGMFEKRTVFEDSLFYDISGWTYPLAFNLEYGEMTGRDYSRNQLGDKVESLEMPKGKVFGGQSAYAYAFEWHGYYAPRAAYRLIEKGIRIKVSTKKFIGPGEQEFDRGTIMIPVANQTISEYDLFQMMETIANEDALDVHSLSTGLTGGVSLEVNTSINVQKPIVALIVEGGSSYDIGEVWHLLDTRMQIPASKLPVSRIGASNIDRYNTMVITDGLNLSEGAINNLKRWIRNGGTLIGTGSAVAWMSQTN